ncbi:hypothetical protein AB835_06780 [Candidatus Endobugula sertula]|uniref:Uncharacterized protein n=1 Tax=Candidatus Endobugula sertula TaxID=62101 RepID=A0A1D2QQN4_9GAMM|nr:hypothetical protein AB835_06780 [Candidatus Endobugula sertula]
MNNDRFDFIIIGASIIGLTIAGKLSNSTSTHILNAISPALSSAFEFSKLVTKYISQELSTLGSHKRSIQLIEYVNDDSHIDTFNNDIITIKIYTNKNFEKIP